MCGSVGKEDSILGINEGGGVVQSGLPVCMVLAVAALPISCPVCKGVSMCVVLKGT
jgi:hypothetical protein